LNSSVLSIQTSFLSSLSVAFFLFSDIAEFKYFPLSAIRKTSSYYNIRIQLKIPTL